MSHTYMRPPTPLLLTESAEVFCKDRSMAPGMMQTLPFVTQLQTIFVSATKIESIAV